MEEKKASEPNPQVDLLTLNKQVVEEISNDFKYNDKAGKYVDPFKRRDQLDSKCHLNSSLILLISAGTDNIELIGSKKPESEESKMNNLQKQRQARNLADEIADKNSELGGDQEKILELLTDMILEEYVKHERQTAAVEHMDEEEKEYYKQRERVTGFMAGLNQSAGFSRDHIDPTIKDIGEKVFDEKIESIFKDLTKEKKQQELFEKTLERQKTINQLKKSATMVGGARGKGKVDFEESWEDSDEDVKQKASKTSKKGAKSKQRKSKERVSVIEEQSVEESPSKGFSQSVTGGGMIEVVGGPQQIMVGANPGVIGAYPYAVSAPPPQIVQVPAEPSFSLADIQNIVSSTIAYHLKRDVNYLEPQYHNAAPMYYNQVGNNQRLSGMPVNDEEAKLKAEENEYKKGALINLAPYVQQTLGVNVSRPVNAGYVNPFLGGMVNSAGVNPPQLINLDDYELSSASELYSEDNEYDQAFGMKNYDDSKNTDDSNEFAKSKHVDRYADSADHKFNVPQPGISQISSIEILKDKKSGKVRLPKNRHPGDLMDDLDPEIEAAKRTYKKKGRIEITEEDED